MKQKRLLSRLILKVLWEQQETIGKLPTIFIYYLVGKDLRCMPASGLSHTSIAYGQSALL